MVKTNMEKKTTSGEAFRSKQNKFPYFALLFFQYQSDCRGICFVFTSTRWDNPNCFDLFL